MAESMTEKFREVAHNAFRIAVGLMFSRTERRSSSGGSGGLGGMAAQPSCCRGLASQAFSRLSAGSLASGFRYAATRAILTGVESPDSHQRSVGVTSVDRSDRIKFEDMELQQLPSSRCSGRVVLSWEGRKPIAGTAEGVDSPTGVLRCAAEATARALELAVDNRISLRLLGVRTIKAFDAIVVVVSLHSRVSDHEQRVVGTAVIDSQPSRAAVNAVLSATNRLLGNNPIFLR